MKRTKIFLDEEHLPKAWYNIAADMPVPIPPILHPLTKQPVGPDDLLPLFPMALIMQAVSKERYIEIPEPVLDVYRLWRPTPLVRAYRLERALDTPAKIYYKNESVSPVGSHKPNTAVAQAFYAKEEGVKRLTTETGAGQWGSALSMACNFFDLGCKVYMVKVSYNQKPYRRSVMEIYGATVTPSPSTETKAGRDILAKNPDSNGSLGIAISEAVEAALGDPDAKYSLGSVLDYVLLHQTVIGQEALKQMEIAGDYPDVVIGCIGGGSNFSGFAFPFIHQNLTAGKNTRILAVEPTASPSVTKGIYAFDYGDTAKMAPIAKMHTLGHSFVPAAIHAGGLRYHGMAPLVSALCNGGYIEAVAYQQNAVFEAAMQFAKTEGHIPAPETAHATRAAIDEALKAKEEGRSKVILFNHSGHGLLDLAAYDEYLAGKLIDYELPDKEIERALEELPEVAF
jgi:tryptophan synthase beta chain